MPMSNLWCQRLAIIQCLWPAHCLTDAVLEVASVVVVHHALVDDSEGEQVPVGSRAISSERCDACECTRFGVNVA